MFEIIEDIVEDYDFFLIFCSVDMFKYFYFNEEFVFGCYGNLVVVFLEFDILEYYVCIIFNIFMNVEVDVKGKIFVFFFKFNVGDYIIFEVKMDLIVGLIVCLVGELNNFCYKLI